MKSNLMNTLQNIIIRKENICTLCLTTVNDLKSCLNITNKVIHECGSDESYVDILNFIFTPGVSKDFITTVICLQCAKSALSSYLFMKMVNNNAQNLSKIVGNLANILNSNLDENLEYVETLYLLNKNFKFQSCYDCECSVNSIEAAKLRLATILSVEQDDETICITLEPESRDNELSQQSKRNRKHITLVNMFEREGNIVKCKLCLKTFTAMEYFTKHYYRLHAPKTVQCPKCPKLFGSTSILKQHQHECHFEAICPECGKTFNNSHYFRQHALSHQTSYACDKCKHVYKTKETYKTHIRSDICNQKQRKPCSAATFTCDMCNKMFCQKSSLKVHVQFVHGHGKAHACHTCSKRFAYQSHLNAHLLKHTQIKNFTCTTCNASFSSKNGLLVHTRLHSGEKPYTCDECDAAFISASRRSMHVQIFHRYNYFECEVCCTKFKNKQSFKRHTTKIKCHSKSLSSKK